MAGPIYGKLRDVYDDRLADVAGHLELVAPVGLAVDDNLLGAPIEFVERQSRDFDRAQAQPGEQQQDRVRTRDEVADDGQRDHDEAAATEALHRAERNELGHVLAGPAQPIRE